MICLPKEKIDAFKQALRDKTLNLTDLLDSKMTSEARTKIFSDYTKNVGDAKALNTLFEEKLVLKNRMLGIANLFQKVGEFGKNSKEALTEKAKTLSDYKAAQNERIFSPKEHEAFLNDLADKKLGIHISKDVAQKVFDMQSKVNSLKDVNQKMSGYSDEYLNAKKELDNYVQSQKPVSAYKSIGKNLAIIGRNNLLLNPSTPVKTSVGQIINSTMDYVTRRIGTMSVEGGNYDLVKKANSEAWDTFKKTGVNTASMESPESGKLGEGKNFDVSSGMDSKNPVLRGAESAIRTVAKYSNKIAIDLEHNYTFTKFYQKAFFDMGNVFSNKIAGGDVVKAGEIFKDAVRVEPQTDEGLIVRRQAQEQAARVTSTNTTYISRLSKGIQNTFNKVMPGLGDVLVPIVKIPGNLIANGIENSGVGIVTGAKDIIQGRIKIGSEDLPTRYEGMAQFAKGVQTMSRTVGTLGVAALLTFQLTKQDFKKDIYGDSFVRIRNPINGQDIWVNTEYISFMSPAVGGMMAVKQEKRGSSAVDTAGSYVAGSLEGLKRVPGISEADTLVNDITNSNISKGIGKYISTFTVSRGVPAFIQNFLKDRPVNRLFFGASGLPDKKELNKLKAK